MQRVIKNAKSHETEPGCQAYFFFIPKDGNEEFLYGVEMYLTQLPFLTAVTMTKRPSRTLTSTLKHSNPSLRNPRPPTAHFI